MEKRIIRFQLQEIKELYAEDLERLQKYEQLRDHIKSRLEREYVLELLGLKNIRIELENSIAVLESKISQLHHQKEQYDPLFCSHSSCAN